MKTQVNFEWDEEKNALNIKKHGISFEDAVSVFGGDYDLLTKVGDRFDYGEVREISLGVMKKCEKAEAVVVVVHTDRSGITRLISARYASKQERDVYKKRVTP